ncbi:MAG: hypothetical protein GY811_00075 [Myxococcales bacterium]|nr:hypothetical protein [Myxococcales bacterium]
MNRSLSKLLSVSLLSVSLLSGSLLSGSLLLACSGGGASRPSTLQWHYDEVHIAQFSLDEKSSVLSAQNEYQRARAEQMKAESEFKESKTKLQVAKNERKQALLSEKSAIQEKRAANESGDMNRTNRAAKDQRVAELGRRASDDRVSYIRAHRKYLKKLVRYRQEETYHKEARYEYEKAKLGQAKNIAPKGIKYENYKGQVDARSRRAQKAKLLSQQAKQKAMAAEKVWKGRLQEVKQAKGLTSDSSTTAEGATEGSGSED